MRLNDTSVWQDGTGPDSDVVVSSRVRLARNLAGVPFVNAASAAQRHEVIRMVQHARWPGEIAPNLVWVNLQQATPLDRTLLVERHLISKQFADGDLPRSVAITHDESLSVMVNEEDHLRMQVLKSGMRLSECFERIEGLDVSLERSLDFAFLPRWGYLTACPTNVGCGIRFSVMLHLPGLKLTNELEKVRRAAKDMHLAVRGFYGEGSEAIGDFFQVSNQITLGRSEADLFDHFATCIVPNLVEYERTARSVLLNQSRTMVDDRVHRSLATLRAARLLTAEEAMKHLSRVRLGVCLGRLSDVDLATVHRLFLQSQPAHLKVLTSPDEPDPELRETRATLMRRVLS
jgi:protein arginine kinase